MCMRWRPSELEEPLLYRPLENGLGYCLATAILGPIQSMVVNHRSGDIGMSCELLYLLQALSSHQGQRYSAVSKAVGCEALGVIASLLHGLLGYPAHAPCGHPLAHSAVIEGAKERGLRLYLASGLEVLSDSGLHLGPHFDILGLFLPALALNEKHSIITQSPEVSYISSYHLNGAVIIRQRIA